MNHDIVYSFALLCLGQILQKNHLTTLHCPFLSFFLHIYVGHMWDWEQNSCVFFFLFEGNFCQTQCLICAIVPLPFEETKFLSVITLSVTLPSESCFQYQLGTQKGNSAAYRCSFSWYIPLFVLKSSGILQTCLPGCCLCWLSRDRCLCAVSPFFHLKGRVLPNKPFVKS